ncbi:MAG: hypothetical protein AAGG01_00775 [Planctomycetota bacterium]
MLVRQDCAGCSALERTAVVLDRRALLVGGTPFILGTPVPASIGGTGEIWASVSELVVNDAGDYVVRGATFDGSSYRNYTLRNGEFFVREDDDFAGGVYQFTRDTVLTSDGDMYHVSRWLRPDGTFVTSIFHEDQLVLSEGDLFDDTGDGIGEPEYFVSELFTSEFDTPRFTVSDDGRILGVGEVRRQGEPSETALLEVPYGLGVRYCNAVSNSLGVSARTYALGTDVASQQSVRLRATNVPSASVGYFLVGDAATDVLNPGGSTGRLCVGGSIGRYVGPGQVQAAGADEALEIQADLSQIPQATGPVAVSPGQTWNFTAWFRDSVNGIPTSNFADAVSVTFR